MSRARVIPAIDQLLGLPAVQRLIELHGPRRLRQVLDEVVDGLRTDLLEGAAEIATREGAVSEVLERVTSRLAAEAPTLRPVLNATGVVIHTNLGRAPLSRDAVSAMANVGGGYSTLEIDQATGQRGSRHRHLDDVLRAATGAEAGVITNNTAAGLTLALAALASGREVIVSRGELVEIGGGFRVPEILRGSGAQLREVGTTNRTRVADYAAAISDRTAAILRVHPSNFRIEGFTERPPVRELAAVAHRFGVPLIEDVGSGWLGFDLFPDRAFPSEAHALLAGEPAVRQSVQAGADLVAFSGDKLLGGPQAGIVTGKAVLVERMRQHPLMRAVRADKVTYAALGATLRAFVDGRAAQVVPVMQMIAMPVEAIARRAEALAASLVASGVPASIVDGESTIGGGSVPGGTLPTRLVRLAGDRPDARLARLREADPPVIARIVDDAVCLDLRTIAEQDDQRLADVVRAHANAPTRE